MEQRVADTILEETTQVTIAGEKYEMPPPSFATLILFSKYVGKMPKELLDDVNPIASLLQQADKMNDISNAVACLVLGAKKFKEKHIEPQKRNIFYNLFKKKKNINSERTKGDVLAEKIQNADISEVYNVFIKLLHFMKLQDFFQLTTSLIELNLTKRTKTEEVETKTTVLGQS